MTLSGSLRRQPVQRASWPRRRSRGRHPSCGQVRPSA